MQKRNVSAVSFINSLPFVYGLQNTAISEIIELSCFTPSIIADRLKQKKTDIGLIPVAALPSIQNCTVIPGYCIGSNYKARTVLLVSRINIKKIKKVIIDPDSRTSNKLAKILFKYYWKQNISWINPNFKINPNFIADDTAAILIGDKVFEAENRFPFQYDLAEEWKNHTGLPFVFACWASIHPLDQAFIDLFNSGLKYGLDNLDKAIADSSIETGLRPLIKQYLTLNISHIFDPEKQKALNLFLQLCNH